MLKEVQQVVSLVDLLNRGFLRPHIVKLREVLDSVMHRIFCDTGGPLLPAGGLQCSFNMGKKSLLITGGQERLPRQPLVNLVSNLLKFKSR